MSQPAARPVPVIKKRKKPFTWDDIELTLLALPTTVWFILFSYLPMFGILLAFKSYNPLAGGNFFTALLNSEWAGFDNFRFMFMSPDAAIMIRNTLLYNLLFICAGLVINVTLAVLISQMHSRKLQRIFQTCMFLPHFLSWVVVAYFVFAFFSVEDGLINNMIESMGGAPVNWYSDGKYWPYILFALNIWKNVGYNMVVYLATLTGIDGSYYEAAIIDGASKWQQVRFITIPLLRPVMTILTLLSVGRIFNSDFGLFWQGTRHSGATQDSWQTVDTYVYQMLMQRNNLSFASAASVGQALLGCILLVLANLLVRKLDPDSSLF